METWATFSIIDYLKPIGDQTQEEMDQLEAVDYLREAQAGELSFFCREFTLPDAPNIAAMASRTLATVILKELLPCGRGRERSPDRPWSARRSALARIRRERRVAFSRISRAWSLLICVVKNSNTRCAAFGVGANSEAGQGRG